MSASHKALRYFIITFVTALIASLVGGALYLHWKREIPEPYVPGPEQSGYRYIGLVIPRSGPLKAVGDSMLRGAEMAVKQANIARAKDSRPFKLLIEDETAKIEPVNRLANDPRVTIIVGHTLEEALEKSLTLYQASGMPIILPLISDPGVTKLGPGRFFRLMPSDTDQARALATYARDELHAGRVLVVHDESAFGRAVTEAFTEELKGSDRLKVATISYPENPGDLLQLAEDLKENPPDAIFLGLQARPAMFLAQALHQAEAQTILLGTHALAVKEVVPILDRLADQVYVALPFTFTTPNKEGAAFFKEYETLHRRHVSWPGIMTYEAVRLAIQALDRAGSDPGRMREYLRHLKEPPTAFTGLMGEYTFDGQGNGHGPVFIVEIGPPLMGRVP